MAGEALNRPLPTTPTSLPDPKNLARIIARNLNRVSQQVTAFATAPVGQDLDLTSPLSITALATTADPETTTGWVTIETLAYVIPDTYRGLWEYGATIQWSTDTITTPVWFSLSCSDEISQRVQVGTGFANGANLVTSFRTTHNIAGDTSGTLTLRALNTNVGGPTLTINQAHLWARRIVGNNFLTAATS